MGEVMARFIDGYDTIQIVNTFHPDTGYERCDAQTGVVWRIRWAQEEFIELGVGRLVFNHDRMEEMRQGNMAGP